MHITIANEQLQMKSYGKRRVGRLKNVWWTVAMHKLWEWIGQSCNEEFRYTPLDIKRSAHIPEIWRVADEIGNPT